MLNNFTYVPAPDVIWSENVAIAFGSVRWYAIFIMIGFIIAILAACLKMWKRYFISTEPFYWFILIGVPLAIFGANFGSCVLGEPAGKSWSEFWMKFGEGLAIEWGILFVVVAAFVYFPLALKSPRYRVRDKFNLTHEVKKVSFWMYADAIMPCILIAQFIGRWGNYMNQEVYGSLVTDESLCWFLHNCLPYMWVQDSASSPAGYHQPLFLWEGIGNLCMFFILYFGIEFIKQRKAGDLAGLYILWYGMFRLCLEPLRDSQYKSSTTMILSSIFVAAGISFILINRLLIAKVRDKKIWHTLFSRGPWEVFRMIGAGWNNQNLINRYKDKQYFDCIRQPQEMIYFGAW